MSLSEAFSISFIKLYYTHTHKEYWSGLPFPSSGNLSDPGIKFRSPALQADYLPLSYQGRPFKIASTNK